MSARLVSCSVACLIAVSAFCQDRLPHLPGYDQFQKNRDLYNGAVRRGDASVTWIEDGKALVYDKDGQRTRLDLSTLKEAPFSGELPTPTPPSGFNRDARRQGPDRGRQFSETFTADGKLKAYTKDSNCWVSNADGSNPVQVTSEGSKLTGIKYAIGSWVYGEELGQRDAMGFSPDGSKLWFYRFDESKVIPYYIAMAQTKVQDALDDERYPKAGAPNPEVDLFVYDLASKQAQKVKVRPGAFDEGVGHYVYGIRWSPDGKELWFHRTNRWQNTMEWCAANPTTGAVRVIVREESPDSWTDNSPQRRFLDDQPDIGQAPQFKGKVIWSSERNGFDNYYLLSLDGSGIKPITSGSFEAAQIVKIDLKNNLLFYMARDGDNPYKLQLHRVGMDGKGDVRLTDPSLNHTVNVSSDGKHFVDTYESLDVPPTTVVRDENGKALATLAKSDLSTFQANKLQLVERLKFKAWDGKTDIYATLSKPSNFDPNKKYPVLIQVYGGPESDLMSERFAMPSSQTEYGFLIAKIFGRGSQGRGKKFKDEMYLKMGIPEIDDQAAGAKYLATKPYVEASKIGIEGTSYGGYASLMCLLRHPDIFAAAASQSPVTAWENYDTIYTERYMRTPQTNPDGYKNGSAMSYAKDLKGRLMLYFGSADNNVHPSNSLQLIQALQRAGKNFEVQVGPDQGHSAMNNARMWEFFIERMVLGR